MQRKCCKPKSVVNSTFWPVLLEDEVTLEQIANRLPALKAPICGPAMNGYNVFIDTDKRMVGSSTLHLRQRRSSTGNANRSMRRAQLEMGIYSDRLLSCKPVNESRWEGATLCMQGSNCHVWTRKVAISRLSGHARTRPSARALIFN